MKLHDTVTRFCTETFVDVTDSEVTFKGKVNPFSDVVNSGNSALRRSLETAPDTVIPPGRVIIGPANQIFIVSSSSVDYWDGTPIRKKFSIIPSEHLGVVGTIEQILRGNPGTEGVYAYPYFTRREINALDLSDYLLGMELYLPNVLSFVRADVYVANNEYYRMKTDTWIDGIGFSVSQVVRLENAVQTFDVTTKSTTYDPVTDGYTETVVSDIDCFVEPMVKDYEFVTPAFEKIEAGDKAISVLLSDVEVAVNDNIGSYRILSLRSFGTWVTCHCRQEN